jgi:hypothetical protein
VISRALLFQGRTAGTLHENYSKSIEVKAQQEQTAQQEQEQTAQQEQTGSYYHHKTPYI